MKYLCYILGVLIVFPLKILSVGSVNYKFDEILLVFIFVILFCTRGIAVRPLVYLWSYISILSLWCSGYIG